MPYICEESRRDFDGNIECLANSIQTEGEANYVISRIISIVFGLAEPKYERINRAIGTLECVKLELYRRMSLYEDIKIEENGDIHEYSEFKSKYKG